MVPQLQFLGLVDTATGEHVPPNWFRFTEKAIEWYRQQQADQERIVAIVEPVQALQEAKGVDVFISHAWEDKEEFVRGLAEALVARGLNVWYDDFTLKVGDRLRESIDHGLRESRFGVVVLSPAFFAKNWTAYELNGLVTKSMSGSGEKIILPVWHNVKADEVREYSLSLADIVALNTNRSSVEAIAAEIAAVVAH